MLFFINLYQSIFLCARLLMAYMNIMKLWLMLWYYLHRLGYHIASLNNNKQ
jgi:hypothetical protein